VRWKKSQEGKQILDAWQPLLAVNPSVCPREFPSLLVLSMLLLKVIASRSVKGRERERICVYKRARRFREKDLGCSMCVNISSYIFIP
jgi:hypothetical protein